MPEDFSESIVESELRRLRRWQWVGWTLVAAALAAGGWVFWRFVLMDHDEPRRLGRLIAEATALAVTAAAAWVQNRHQGVLVSRITALLGFRYERGGRRFETRLPWSPRLPRAALRAEDYFAGTFEGQDFECAEMVLTVVDGKRATEILRFLLLEWRPGTGGPRLFLAHDDALSNKLAPSLAEGEAAFQVQTKGKSVVRAFVGLNVADTSALEPFAQAIANAEDLTPEGWRFLFAECLEDRLLVAVRIRYNFVHVGGLWTGRAGKIAQLRRARADMLAAAGIVVALRKAGNVVPSTAGPAQVNQTRA